MFTSLPLSYALVTLSPVSLQSFGDAIRGVDGWGSLVRGLEWGANITVGYLTGGFLNGLVTKGILTAGRAAFAGTVLDIAWGVGWDMGFHGDNFGTSLGNNILGFGFGELIGAGTRATRELLINVIGRGIHGLSGDAWRFGWDAYQKTGILPWHAVNIQRYANENGLGIYFRFTKHEAALWNVLGLPAKPGGWGLTSDPRLKTNVSGFSVDRSFSNNPFIIRGDYDLALITRGPDFLLDEEVNRILPALDAAARGRTNPGAPLIPFLRTPGMQGPYLGQIKHSTHLTYYNRAPIGHPGDIFGFLPGGSAILSIPRADVRGYVAQFGYSDELWPSGWGP